MLLSDRVSRYCISMLDDPLSIVPQFHSCKNYSLPNFSCGNTQSATPHLKVLLPLHPAQKSPDRSTEITMCLFSTPKKHHRHRYVEEVYIAPRPVSRHSHHHDHNGRASYTSVTRTSSRPVAVYVDAPRMSQSSYRRSGPVIVEETRRSGPLVVEERRSTRSYR